MLKRLNRRLSLSLSTQQRYNIKEVKSSILLFIFHTNANFGSHSPIFVKLVL